MEEKKYELIRSNESSFASFRIRALRDIPKCGVRKGDMGGLVLSELNLSQNGDGWIDDTSEVLSSAVVVNGYISDGSTVAGDAYIHSGLIKGSKIVGDTMIEGDITVRGSTIKNSRLIGDGVVSKSHLVNCQFHCAFDITSSTVQCRFPRSPFHVTDTLHLKDVNLIIEQGDVMAMVTMERVHLFAEEFRVEHLFTMKDVHARTDRFLIDRMSDQEALRTGIIGEKENPIDIKGEKLLISNSLIKGSMLLSGSFEIRESTLQGMHHIEMNKGYIENTTFNDFVTIKQTLPRVQVIVGKKIEGDISIDFDKQ